MFFQSKTKRDFLQRNYFVVFISKPFSAKIEPCSAKSEPCSAKSEPCSAKIWSCSAKYGLALQTQIIRH